MVAGTTSFAQDRRARNLCHFLLWTPWIFVAHLVLAGCAIEPITLETLFLRPTSDEPSTPTDYGVDYDEVLVPMGDKREVSVWHAKANHPKGVVVIIPGSDSNKSRYVVSLPVFIPSGYDVILMDYEGYGDSSGAPPELERLTEDGFAVVRYAQTLHRNVVVFGVSAGGPTAVRVAADLDLSGVIVEAPLVLKSQVEAWLRKHNLALPPLWELANLWVYPQVPDGFDILKYVQLVDEPKLIMQSRDDDLVAYECGRSVYDAAPEPKAFAELRGGHAQMIELDPELYKQTIVSWLDGPDGAGLDRPAE